MKILRMVYMTLIASSLIIVLATMYFGGGTP